MASFRPPADHLARLRLADGGGGGSRSLKLRPPRRPAQSAGVNAAQPNPPPERSVSFGKALNQAALASKSVAAARQPADQHGSSWAAGGARAPPRRSKAPSLPRPRRPRAGAALGFLAAARAGRIASWRGVFPQAAAGARYLLLLLYH